MNADHAQGAPIHVSLHYAGDGTDPDPAAIAGLSTVGGIGRPPVLQGLSEDGYDIGAIVGVDTFLPGAEIGTEFIRTAASNMKCNTHWGVMCCDGNDLQTFEL
jgi:hypothetical protein